MWQWASWNYQMCLTERFGVLRIKSWNHVSIVMRRLNWGKISLSLCPPRTPECDIIWEWVFYMQLIKDQKIKSLRIFRDLMSNGWHSYETKRNQTGSQSRRPHAARGREYKMSPWSHQILERARRVSFSLQLLKGEWLRTPWAWTCGV